MLMAGSSVTQHPFALSLFSSIKSAFLCNATTVLNEVRNATLTHMAVDRNLVEMPVAEVSSWHSPCSLQKRRSEGCESVLQLLRNAKLLCDMNSEQTRFGCH